MEAFWEAAEAEYQAMTGGVRHDPVQIALEQFEATYEPNIEPASAHESNTSLSM